MSVAGTARIMRLSVDPAGVGWASGDALLDFDGLMMAMSADDHV